MIVPGIGGMPPPPQVPPIVRDVVTTEVASGTPIVPTMPTHVAGDLLLVLVGYRGGSGLSVTGWSEDAEKNDLYGVAAYSKKATSSSTTISIVNPNNDYACVHAYSIEGASGAVKGTSLANTRNPPSVTCPWGLEPTLWFVALGTAKSVKPGAAPSGFGDTLQTIAPGVGDAPASLSSARKIDWITTLDPSGFSGSDSTQDAVLHVAIRPY